MRLHLSKIAKRCIAALAAGIIAVSAIVGNPVSAQAAGETGTLTIIPKADGTEVSASSYDGTFKIYKIADYDTSGTLTAMGDFHYDGYESTLTMDYLSDEQHYKSVAQTITAWIDAHSDIEATLSAIKVGEVNTLPYGLYLIHQDQSASSYTDTTPFLVMIPAYTDGATNTNVTAYPKITKTETPDTPDEPHKPHQPDTPVPAKTGKVALGKSDSETGTPLAGVVFTLYKNDGTAIGTYTTDSEGLIYVDNLPYGDYYFVETQALDGYILDQTQQGFQISSTDTQLLTMTNTPIPETPEQGEEIGGFTGDESNMMLYGAAVAVAAVALVAWFIWKKRSEKETK